MQCSMLQDLRNPSVSIDQLIKRDHRGPCCLAASPLRSALHLHMLFEPGHAVVERLLRVPGHLLVLVVPLERPACRTAQSAQPAAGVWSLCSHMHCWQGPALACSGMQSLGRTSRVPPLGSAGTRWEWSSCPGWTRTAPASLVVSAHTQLGQSSGWCQQQ